MSRTVTITAERTPQGWWALEVDGVGVSQVRRLDQAVTEMTEPIEFALGVPIGDLSVEVVPVLPAEYEREAQAAKSARAAAREQTAAAAEHSRAAARVLADAGLSLRDVGTVMDISFQRAGQLLR